MIGSSLTCYTICMLYFWEANVEAETLKRKSEARKERMESGGPEAVRVRPRPFPRQLMMPPCKELCSLEEGLWQLWELQEGREPGCKQEARPCKHFWEISENLRRKESKTWKSPAICCDFFSFLINIHVCTRFTFMILFFILFLKEGPPKLKLKPQCFGVAYYLNG